VNRFLLALIAIFIFVLPLSAEARHYSRSFSHHSRAAIFGKTNLHKKKLFATKSVFEPRPKFRQLTRQTALVHASKHPDGSMA